MFQYVFVYAIVSLWRNWETIFGSTRAFGVVTIDSEVPLIPLNPLLQSYSHCWIHFHGLIETAESASAVPLRLPNPLLWSHRDHWRQTFLYVVLCWKLPFCVQIMLSKFLLWIPRSHWKCWSRFRGLIEAAEAAFAVSLKLPNPLPQPHWNRRSGFRGLIETTEADNLKLLSQISRLFQSHMRNGFSRESGP
jgi:hypothetical protein